MVGDVERFIYPFYDRNYLGTSRFFPGYTRVRCGNRWRAERDTTDPAGIDLVALSGHFSGHAPLFRENPDY